MRLHHVALVRSSEAAAERFFGGLLGLHRRREKTAGAELCRALFGVAREHPMIDYANENLLIEVFLAPAAEATPERLSHVCLDVDDRAGLLTRCAAAGVEVRRATKGDSEVVFLVDEDGNLYEIKQRATAT